VKKDVVTVPMHQTVEVDLVADIGFMALMRYL